MRTAGLLALAVLAPSFAHAAVRVNEVAWMGSVESSNAEWIELANTGNTAVDLTGWHIKSASGAPSFSLLGTIAANGFFLLERTSDDAVPGIAADQIYTGSLPNSGTVLTLVDADGTVVDTVDGSDAWSALGGDNTTKDTAQRTSAGWVTAAPTPRAATASDAAVAASKSDGSATTTATSATTAAASDYVPPATGELVTAIQSHSDAAYVNVPIRFSASAKTTSGKTDAAADIAWSFGDGSSARGAVVTKTYQYPGTYVVVVRATDGSAYGEDAVVMTVTQANVRIAGITGDGIVLANDTDKRLDLSNWELTSGTGSFRLPLGTTLLPHTQTLFPYTIVNVPHSYEVSLLYPNRIVAVRYSPAAPVAPMLSEELVATTSATTSRQLSGPVSSSPLEQRAVPSPVVAKNVNAPTHDLETVSAPTKATEVAAVGAALQRLPTSTPTQKSTSASHASFLASPWTLGFLGLAVVAGGALLIL